MNAIKLFLIFYLIPAILFFDDAESKFSIMLNANYKTNWGVSDAMKGSSEDFINDLSFDYNNQNFPYGDEASSSMNIGLQLAYKYKESPFSSFLSFNFYNFNVDKKLENSNRNSRVDLNAVSITPGFEFLLGDRTNLLNYFFRLGINMNIFSGKVDYFMVTDVNPAFRLGGELEIGCKLNIPDSRISVEVSSALMATNVIGKSYNKFYIIPPWPLNSRDLNDGKNPENQKDADRNISFMSLRLGLRYNL